MPMVRIAIVSVPSGSVTTLGRFSIAPTPRIATWGWLMIGAPAYDPNTPGFVIVKVPRWISSGESFLVRARSRSEEHTSELQSHSDLVCRLLLEKKKKRK